VSAAAAPDDLDRLEQQRRRTLKRVVMALAFGLAGFPLGFIIGDGIGTDAAIIAAEGLWLAALLSLVAAPVMAADWRRSVAGSLLDATVAGSPGLRRIDGERAGGLTAPDAALFQGSGLVEPFQTSRLINALAGQSLGVSFVLAELSLYDQKEHRVFGGVLGSFRLARPLPPGLTIVTRDRGLLGNLLARAGSGIEPVTLEDPGFEGVFEAYGTDQVAGRVILTTTMLGRLRSLDELAHARGFSCAFRDDHLLVALPGMRWRCAMWRLLQPMSAWLPAYRDWLGGLVELPARIAATLDLAEPAAAEAAMPAMAPATAADRRYRGRFGRDDLESVAAVLWRLGGAALPALYIAASGLLFGGLAVFGAWYGITEGYSDELFWYFWFMVAFGLAYGAGTIATAVRQLLHLAWTWNAPLRGLSSAGRATGKGVNGL
jgi:hypothetical protein